MRGVAARVRPAALAAAVLLLPGSIAAQSISTEIQHVKWALLDVVIVPESTGVWVIAGPTPGTTQWESGSHLVSIGVEPVTALQWATLSRKLSAAGIVVTPKLHDLEDPEFIILGKNPRKAPDREAFVLVATDSSSKVQWKSFASSAQIDSLLTALERAAAISLDRYTPGLEPDPETPVRIVKIPDPVYPPGLGFAGRIGRVWLEYVVDSDGRVRQGSVRALLSDDSRFSRSAIQAVVHGRFQPALTAGRPVSQRVFQAVHFKVP